MQKRSGVLRSGQWLILGLLLLPVFSCTTINEIIMPPTATPTPTITPSPTPTNTPTPTPYPLAERDLKEIVLRKSDLPNGFNEVDIPDVEQLFGQMDSEIGDILSKNLAKGFMSVFTARKTTMYANMILVYKNAGSASSAYESYWAAQNAGEEEDIPKIGENSFARFASNDEVVSYAIVWQYHEAILELDFVGEEDITIDELVDLAQIVQSRLEAA